MVHEKDRQVVSVHELIVRPELEALLPPLEAHEREALRASLARHGMREPVTVGRDEYTCTVLDGHNRLAWACAARKERVRVRRVDVRTHDEAVAWMMLNQRARRSLTKDQITAISIMSGMASGIEYAPQEIARIRLVEGRPDLLAKMRSGAITLRQAAGRADTRPKAARKPRATKDPLTRERENRVTQGLKSDVKKLAAQLEDAHTRAGLLDALRAPAAPVRLEVFARTAKRAATPVCVASDWHVEETVTREQALGRNEYNLEIAARRVERLFAGAMWLNDLYRERFEMRSMVLALAGDLMSGYIHDELVETNALSPTETIVWLRRHLTAGIHTLLADPLIEHLVIPCVHGNHGRTTAKRRVATGALNSYEWLLYQTLKEDFSREPRVTFQVDTTSHQYVTVGQWTLHITHGDEIGYGGGVGGIGIPVNKRVPQWNRVKHADYHYIGHFHQLLDLGHTCVNGSLIGYNAYAMSIGATFEHPRQTYHLIDAERGKTCVTPIWVGESEGGAK